jgi:hypothetical protein
MTMREWMPVMYAASGKGGGKGAGGGRSLPPAPPIRPVKVPKELIPKEVGGQPVEPSPPQKGGGRK